MPNGEREPQLDLDDIQSQAATILYALVREAGSPYLPPRGSTIQLHVEKDTWHAARNWFLQVTLSPFPPLPPPTPPL